MKSKPLFHPQASVIGLVVAAAVLGLVFICGCAITLSDEGEVAFKFTQGFTVSHKAVETDAESKATADFKPLVDYIVKLREPTTQPAVSD